MLAGEVESPVFREVAVADDRAQGEDCLGAVQAPSRAADREAVGDEVPAGALDDPGRDRPAGREGLVVTQVLAFVSQVADASVGAVPPAAGQAGGVGFGGDRGGGPVAVAGQDREGPGRDPVLGGGIAGLVEAPRGAPYVLELSAVSASEGSVSQVRSLLRLM